MQETQWDERRGRAVPYTEMEHHYEHFEKIHIKESAENLKIEHP
jgi:hypothetical protein